MLNVAIIGAGPSGTTLARLLYLHNESLPSSPSPHPSHIAFTVYESDSTPSYRLQGGTLDLHPPTGQAALEACGLTAEFQKHARYDGEALTICDRNLLRFVHVGGGNPEKGGRGRPEIDRPVLRKMLLDSVPADSVRWGCKVKEVTRAAEGAAKWNVVFADGTAAAAGPFDLVVGADGAFSKVRPLVTDERPFYSGKAGYWYAIPAPAKELSPEVYELANRGGCFAIDRKTFLCVQYMGDGSITVSTVREVAEGALPELSGPEARKQDLDVLLRGWDPLLRKAVADTRGDETSRRALYMLPVGVRWAHVEGVTLIGDAAHLMTPFAGEGVNVAMRDALELGRAIKAAALGLEGSEKPAEALAGEVSRFEAEMFTRATKVQQTTLDMMNATFTYDGLRAGGAAKFITTAAADEVPSLLYPFFWLATHVYFWVFTMIW